MTGAGDAGPGVAAGSIIGDHHADDSLIAVFGAACAEAARLDTEATHAVRRGTMYALDDRIGQLRADCARLAADLAAARAEVEARDRRIAGLEAEIESHRSRLDPCPHCGMDADLVARGGCGWAGDPPSMCCRVTRTPGGSHGE